MGQAAHHYLIFDSGGASMTDRIRLRRSRLARSPTPTAIDVERKLGSALYQGKSSAARGNRN
jgi:hypothetical protein